MNDLCYICGVEPAVRLGVGQNCIDNADPDGDTGFEGGSLVNDLDIELMRLDLEADTAHATRLILDGHADQVDAYLEARDYVNRVATYRAAKAGQ